MDAAGNMMQEIQVEGMLTDDDRIKIVAAGVDSLTSTSSLSEVGVNGMTWATAAEGIWELPGMIRGGWRAIASWRMASKMAGVRAAGEEGLALAAAWSKILSEFLPSPALQLTESLIFSTRPTRSSERSKTIAEHYR